MSKQQFGNGLLTHFIHKIIFQVHEGSNKENDSDVTSIPEPETQSQVHIYNYFVITAYAQLLMNYFITNQKAH